MFNKCSISFLYAVSSAVDKLLANIEIRGQMFTLVFLIAEEEKNKKQLQFMNDCICVCVCVCVCVIVLSV